jgi:hypothetical protein
MSAKMCERSWLHKVGAVYSKHVGKITKFNQRHMSLVQLHVNFRKQYMYTSKKSPAHLQCVPNNCARFEECQPKGVRGVDYTK